MTALIVRTHVQQYFARFSPRRDEVAIPRGNPRLWQVVYPVHTTTYLSGYSALVIFSRISVQFGADLIPCPTLSLYSLILLAASLWCVRDKSGSVKISSYVQSQDSPLLDFAANKSIYRLLLCVMNNINKYDSLTSYQFITFFVDLIFLMLYLRLRTFLFFSDISLPSPTDHVPMCPFKKSILNDWPRKAARTNGWNEVFNACERLSSKLITIVMKQTKRAQLDLLSIKYKKALQKGPSEPYTTQLRVNLERDGCSHRLRHEMTMTTAK